MGSSAADVVGRPDAEGPRNVADLVRRAAAHAPDRPGLVFGDARLTWSDVDTAVDAAAATFRGMGLGAGDRVVLAMRNTVEAAVAYFGVLRAGLVAVPVDPAQAADRLVRLVADARAAALVGTAEAVDAVGSARGDVPALAHVLPASAIPVSPVTSDGPIRTDIMDGRTFDHGADRGGEDLAVLLYTSGTTGRPRGAMLSHRALLANLAQCARIEPPVLRDDDVVLLALPLFHIFGLNAGLGQVAWQGCTGVLVDQGDGLDPAATLAAIARHRVTNVAGAPPMYVAWSRRPDVAAAFATVRLAVSGAADLPSDARERMLVATGRLVHEGYGLTETAPVLTSTLMSPEPKPGSIGRPVPGVELRLVDPDTGAVVGELPEDSHEPLDEGGPVSGDPGEIAVRGDNLFSGYWPDGSGGPDADGWWRTGDLAVADEDGDLFLVGRLAELMTVRGFHVYPREVEQVLDAHPGVVEAAVIGVPDLEDLEDPTSGQAIKAYVRVAPSAGRTGSTEVTAEELLAHCAARLARFKCPTAVEFVDALPHSAIGKVSKGRLRARAARASAASTSKASSAESGSTGSRSTGSAP